jgi:hypothetical protein
LTPTAIRIAITTTIAIIKTVNYNTVCFATIKIAIIKVYLFTCLLKRPKVNHKAFTRKGRNQTKDVTN